MSSRKRKRDDEESEEDSESESDSSVEKVKKKKKKKEKSKKKKKSKEKKKDKKKKKKKKKEKRERKDQELAEFKSRIPTEKIGIVKLIEQEAFGVCEKTIVKLGAGRKPVKGQEVKIHAKGRFMKSKKKFWDTREKKQEGEKIKPYKFRLGIGKVIKGWDAGVLSMRLGEVAKIVCTGSYAYGLKGNQKWGIPPNSDLEFEIELLAISDDVKLPDKFELMKQKVANKHTFLDREGMGSMLSFRSAPF